ncbi:MAG: RHS repeat-associated core domain-containing protein [Terracidiphilus sp.]
MTTTTYNDSADPPNVVQTELINSTTTLENQTNYDGLGRPVESELTSDPEGTDYTMTTYDSVGRVASVSNPYRFTSDTSYGFTYYGYDALNRMTSQTNPDGGVKYWCYNNIQTNGQQGCQSHHANANGGNGSWVDFQDEDGRQWERTSNGLGRQTSLLEPNGSSASPAMETDYTYSPTGNLQTVVQNGVSGTDTPRTTRGFVYDLLSRLTSATNGESGTTTYVYDGNGNVLQKTSPRVNATSGSGTITLGYCYDAWNHLVGKWSGAPPSGCNTTPTTVASNLLATYTYGGNGSTINAAGRLITESAYLNGTDLSDHTIQQYDPMGRVATEATLPYSPLTGYSNAGFNYLYDLAGDLTFEEPPDNYVGYLTYAYDAADRLTSVNLTPLAAATIPSPTPIFQNPTYSSIGLTGGQYWTDGPSTQSPYLNIIRHYDNRMRAIDEAVYSSSGTVGTATITISGNAVAGDSGTITFTAQGGVAVNVSYNGSTTADSLAQALAEAINNSLNTPVVAKVASGSSTITLYAVAADSNPTISATGVAITGPSDPFTFTQDGTVLSGLSGGSGTNWYTYRVTYNLGGDVTSSQDMYNGNLNYGIDTLHRVTKSQGASPPINGVSYQYQCWSYDSFGNRTSENDQQGSSCPGASNTDTVFTQYNANNQVTGTTGPNSPGLTYSLAGNVVNDMVNTYVYDLEGRLCAVKNATTAWQYVYDAEGRRVAKGTISTMPAPGNTCATPTGSGFHLTNMYFRGSGGNQDVEYDGQGNWIHDNIFANGVLTATYFNNPDQGGTPTSPVPWLVYDFSDWVGTKRAQISEVAQVGKYWLSDPFGDYLTAEGGGVDATEQHFTGQEHDGESGKEYFNARYYGSTLARFQSPDPSGMFFADPLNPQRFNLYAYALNNPLRFLDPSGLELCDWGPSDNGGEDFDDDIDCAADGGTPVVVQQTVSVSATPSDVPLTTPQTCEEIALPKPSDFSQAEVNAVTGAAYSVSIQAYASPNNPFSTGFVQTAASAAQMTANFLAGTGPTYTAFGADSPESMAMAESTLAREAIGNYMESGALSGQGNFEQYGLGPVGAGANPMAQFVGGFTYTMVPFGGKLYMQIYNETSRNSLAYHMASSIPRNNGAGQQPPMSTTIQTYDIAVNCP